MDGRGLHNCAKGSYHEVEMCELKAMPPVFIIYINILFSDPQWALINNPTRNRAVKQWPLYISLCVFNFLFIVSK